MTLRRARSARSPSRTALIANAHFAYYSGRNERIEALFQEHQRRFNQRQEITTDAVPSEQLLEKFTDADIRAGRTSCRRESRLKTGGRRPTSPRVLPSGAQSVGAAGLPVVR